MTFIRPQAREALLRWREVLIGAFAAALGLWWLIGKSAFFLLPGAALALGGLALVWVGIQRTRFRGQGQGPGSVQVDEGEITYYGPLTGGAVALREISTITLDPGLHPAHWRLAQKGVPDLFIPVNAEGADALFDAFSTLPGLRMEQVIAALNASAKHPTVIWQRATVRPSTLSLH